MSRKRHCSVCNDIFDPEDFNDKRRHDTECPPLRRRKILQKKIRNETKSQRMLGYYGNENFNINYDCVVVENSSLGDGAYTSKMTRGISSNQVSEFQKGYQEFIDNTNEDINDESNNTDSRSFDFDMRIENDISNEMFSSSSTSHVGSNSLNIEGSTTTSLQVASMVPPPEEPHQTHMTDIMSTSLCTIKSQHSTFGEGIFFSSSERKYLRLMEILAKINAPNYVFDKIVKWALRLQKQDLDIPMSRDFLIKNTASKFGLRDLFPTVSKLVLPSGNSVTVTKFNFMTSLYSLLTCEKLMRPENLVCGNNIFKRFSIDPNSHCFEDVHTGQWYVDTQFRFCRTENDMVLPIILYIDKTYVKSKPAEPISFSLGIFKRHIRNDPSAWRNLGMIPGKLGDLVPNKDKFPRSKLAEIRLNDWHAVCNFLLSDLKAAQKLGGIHWEFGPEFNNEKCKLHIPIMFIVGDIEGHDKICSRKSGHTNKMKAVTHSCDIRREACGDPNARCRYFEKDEILSLQQIVQDRNTPPEEKNDAILKLNHFGFYSDVKNAFSDMNFGASRFGVHGAVAICLMHTFKQKFPNAVSEIYFLIYSKSPSSKNRLLINRSVTKLVPWVLRQSYRGHPSLHSFSESLLKPKYSLSAQEKFARVFALFLFSMTTYGWNAPVSSTYTQCKNGNQIKLRISLIEDTISIFYLMSCKSFRIQDIDKGKSEVKKYLTKFKQCIEFFEFEPEYESEDNRSDDDSLIADGESDEDEEEEKLKVDRCRFPKFHYLLHVLDMIVRFGSSQNFDGGMNESHHKYLTKAPGQRTQAKTDKFDEQTSTNLVSKIVLDKAFNSLRRNDLTNLNSNQNGNQNCESKEDNQGTSIHPLAAKFDVDATSVASNIRWRKKKYQYPQNLITFFSKVFKEFSQRDETVSITGFTDLCWKGKMIRAHPNYRYSEWYDWVIVKWNVYNKRNVITRSYFCPAKVLLFLKANSIFYAIIHSAEVDEKNGKPLPAARNVWKTRGSSKVCQFWTMEKDFRYVPVETFNDIAFVYSDFSDEEMTKETKFKIQIKKKDEWEYKHL